MSASKNMQCYKQSTPPPIPLGNITEPNGKIFVINSDNDSFGDVMDVAKLKQALKGFFVLEISN